MATVTLNIRGSIFMTQKECLQNLPGSRLSELSPTSEEYNLDKDWYFFDRNPDIFNSILDLYRTGSHLHLPKYLCGAMVQDELKFWKIPLHRIADCCFSVIFKYEDKQEVIQTLKRSFEDIGHVYTDERIASNRWNRIKNKIWTFTSRTHSSFGAVVYSWAYLLMVVLTCLSFILSTHPLFREPYETYTTENQTAMMDRDKLIPVRYQNPKIVMYSETKEHKVLSYFEDFAISYFTIDLVCRIISCPKKIRFICDFHNIVDIWVVVSMLITLIYEKIIFFSPDLGNREIWLYYLCKAAVILRLLRLLRFSKHFKGLQVLFISIKSSSIELGLMGISFGIAVTLFAGLMYYAEFYEPTAFQNIPLTLWWSIITMTTVGYGDFYPTTLPGYIVGSMCAVSGLLLLGMPIAIIATNFTQYYTESKLYFKYEQLTKSSPVKRAIYKLCCRNRVKSEKE
ncbi:hypothetical protein ACJMK2_032385 [Sinanodonta woodiana]|uniref:BTB domain-containing protein n=1 Tax=Sinanodonta woodiana TaxID=1069815 RepID=A0ABD3X1I9_SINWO